MSAKEERAAGLRRRLRALRRTWRGSVRPTWREVQPIVVLALAAAVIVLGTIGFHVYELGNEKDYGVLDSLYRAITLFGFGGGVEPPVPTTLEIARILAPALTGFAVISGLLRLSRDQLQLLGIRLLVRNHAIVAGLGATGSRLAFSLHDAGYRVVVLEMDPANPFIGGARERGIPVLRGDASDPSMLRKARVAQARHLLVTCGDDGRNVNVAMIVGDRVVPGRRGVLTAFVQLADLGLWRALKAEAVLASDRPEFRLEFFNAFATGARMLLEEHSPFRDTAKQLIPSPKPCVVGSGGVSENLVLQIAAQWRSERRQPERLPLVIAGPDAMGQVTELVTRHPELDELCDFQARSADIESARFQHGDVLLDSNGRPDVTKAYVALADEKAALAAALGLHGRPETRHIPVVVAVADQQGGVATAFRAEGRSFAEHVEPFGVLSSALTPKLLLRGMNEMLARASHENYVRTQRARLEREGRGPTPDEARSLKPWEELDESLRDSNRRFADGIGAALDATGYVLVPAPLIDPQGPLPEFTSDEVEQLAVDEHRRWADDLRRDGWKWTSGPKDPVRKLHPLLVGWDDLSEEEREKDRVAVREIPVMLARAGYEMYKPGEGHPPPRSAEAPASAVPVSSG